MKPKEVMLTAGLNGLNWQVHVLPLSLSTTSLPPTFPLFAVGAVVVVAEPQATATRPATTTPAIGLARRIDALPTIVCGRQVHTIGFLRPVPASRVRSDPPVIYRKATLTSDRWSTLSRVEFGPAARADPNSADGTA